LPALRRVINAVGVIIRISGDRNSGCGHRQCRDRGADRQARGDTTQARIIAASYRCNCSRYSRDCSAECWLRSRGSTQPVGLVHPVRLQPVGFVGAVLLNLRHILLRVRMGFLKLRGTLLDFRMRVLELAGTLLRLRMRFRELAGVVFILGVLCRYVSAWSE